MQGGTLLPEVDREAEVATAHTPAAAKPCQRPWLTRRATMAPAATDQARTCLGAACQSPTQRALLLTPGEGWTGWKMGEKDGGGKCQEPRRPTVTPRLEKMGRVAAPVAALTIARVIGIVESRLHLGRTEYLCLRRIVHGKAHVARLEYREGLD